MKKVLLYASIIILLSACVCVMVVYQSIVRIQLPHGAVLHVLPAPKDNHTNGAVILCPGGGYTYLEKWREGYMWFPFFHRRGFAVAMLEYRLPNHDCQAPEIDGAEAVRLMRERAADWNYNENNVGIMGFSAGGHLASTLMVSGKASVRPDFGILFYSVISMRKELTHKGTHDQLLGENASEQLEARYSNELHVTDKTPPTYIVVSSNDIKVNPQNSIYFHDEMRAKNRPVTLHVYPSVVHGWGYQFSFDHHSQMLDDLDDWLKHRQQQDIVN